MRARFLRTAIVALSGICAFHACGRNVLPTTPPSPQTWTVDGVVVYVGLVDRTFLFYGTYEGSSDIDSQQTRFEGDVTDFDGRVTAYRRGLTLKATLRFSSEPRIPYRPETVAITTEPSVWVSLNRRVEYTVHTTPPGISLGYRRPGLLVLPWTQFREDADYPSWDAVLAAYSTGEPLCLVAEGYQVHAYAIHTSKIGVWRRRDFLDYCYGR